MLKVFWIYSNFKDSNAYLYHGAWSTITTGLFLHDLRASFVMLIVYRDEMALVNCIEIASLRSRSKHIATYLILPLHLIFVSSSRMASLSFFLANFFRAKISLNFKIHCLTASLLTPNFLPIAESDSPSMYS